MNRKVVNRPEKQDGNGRGWHAGPIRPSFAGHWFYPFILPVPGKELDGVIGYRDIEDTNVMIAASEVFRKP